MHTNAHSSTIYNCQHMEATQISIDKGMDKEDVGGFPGGAMVENLPANAGDTGLSPGLGRSHMLWSN